MLVVVGDAHLHPYVWASLPRRRGDSYDSFRQATQFAADNRVDGLVLAGDIVNSNNPPMESVAQLLQGVRSLCELRIPVYAIAGNHDPDFWAGVSSDAFDLDKFDAGYLNIHIDGVPHNLAGIRSLPPDELKQRLKTLPRQVDILILHQLMKGLVPDVGEHQVWNLDPEWVPESVRLVLMGDLHAATSLELKRSQHVTKFFYTGSTCLQKVDEPVEKSFITVDGDLNVTRVPFKTRPFLRTTLFHNADGNQLNVLVEKVKALPAGALVSLKYHPCIPDVEEVLKKANADVDFLLKPVSVKTVDPEQQGINLDNVTLESCLGIMVKRETDPLFYDFVLSLLRSKDPKEALTHFREKVLSNENTQGEDQQLLSAQEA